MKRFLFLLLTCLCAVTGAWAEVTVTGIGSGTITISSENAGDINTGLSIALNYQPISDTRIIVQGKVNLDDLTKIKSSTSQSWGNFTFDFSGLTEYPALNTWPKMWQGSAGYPVYILPKGCSGFDESMTTYVDDENTGNGIFNVYGDLQYIIIPASAANNPAYIYIYKRKGTQSIVTDLALDDKSYFTGNESKIEVLGLNGAGAESSWSTLITNLKANGTWGSKISLLPYSVSGCDVTINIESAEAGQTLADLIAAAKAAVIAGGQSGICTLTVTGPVTNNDLIALGGTNMTGATRIDLSGATLASGVSIDNLQVPESLTSIVLPKNQTVNVGLAAKFAAAANLNYAYSPSTDPDLADPTVADYVWVNKAGGMAAALAAEASLRGSKYIKVASNVALNASDVNFSSITAVKYLDLRFANMTQDVSLSYVHAGAPQETGYRLILPDDWTKDEMTAFATDQEFASGAWNMAAIYSYSGTELNIYELNDGKYMTAALSNPRIVYNGTTAIKVVTTLGENLLDALNAAASSVKTITVTASSINNLTFDNANITTLNVTGLNNNYAELNVDGCAVLKNLNVTGSTIKSVDASATSLEAVNLNGSTISNNVDLSGSGLKTLTTNSNTWIQGDLHLESTASFTSFASTAKLGTNSSNGNIYLNASGVSTVDLQSVQFQNNSSEIHIDSTVGEGDTPLTNLNANGQLTIYIPTGFTRTRLHPYSSTTLDDNIAELAATGAFEDGCDPKCRIEYNAETHVATVHCYTPGHFKTLMENDNNYGKFVDGAIFTFDASCKLNADDLAALAGKDGYGNFNWNYVDLYNLPASYTIDETTVNYADVITGAINILRTNNWQYKGLLLPKTTNLGTTLIQDRTEDETKVATCSQFIAYSGAIGTSAMTAAYIYKAADDWGITHAERLGKMKAVMDLHPEIISTTTNWSVSTNSPTPIDMSILPTSVTIEGNTVNTSKLETVNNDMVAGTGKPSIYAYPAYENVMYTVANSTGIGNTPDLEILKVTGPVNAADIASVNQFTDGPRVLDLSATTGGITKAMLESITNDDIEYIILPAGMSKDVVCGANYTSGLKTNLKAVISSTSTNLVAYVNAPGSLAEARYLATGGSTDGTIFSPSQTGLQSVTLAGNLNASDIAANTTNHYLDEYGHWTTTSGNLKSVALWGEQGTITTIDLKDAVFAPQTDMNFSYAGLSSLHDITLPTSESMTLIPAECFMGITTFNDLCIPYNYTKIDNAALLDTYCGHITTTDALNGAVVDNGEHSYTFSANLEEIGSKPSTADANGVYSLDRVVFPQNRGVTDVYVLAHNVPKCYANSFPANMLYGWGGFRGGDFPYCREKYENGTGGTMIFTVLHYPDEASYTASDDKTGSTYEDMEKLYTDINKVYSKKEQTGAVDANGDPIAWPSFAELRRAYNQATDGITWNDWTLEKDGNGEVLGGAQIPTAKNAIAAGPGTNTYTFEDYEGWHQFVLSMATYVEPAKTVENEVIKTNYVQGAWYTLCIPFSLTFDQAVEMLGIPKSVEGKTENYLNNALVEEDQIPDVRTLQTVTRTPGASNTVTMKFTQALVESYSVCRYWNINTENPNNSDYSGTGATDAGEKIAIRGGYPYLIRPYLPENEVVNNLGKYIMTHFSQELKQEMSCIYLDGCWQDLGEYTTENKTGRFTKPFENHKIQAVWDDNDESTPKYRTHSNGKKYNYTFVGQFWDQKLPRYSFYMVENSSNTAGKWYRLASDKNYKWNQYKCIIMVTQEVDDAAPEGRSYLYTNSGKFRNNDQTATTHSIYPVSSGTDAQGAYKFTDHLYIEFLNGLDDADFTEFAGAKYVFAFDDFIQEFDENGNSTTSIDSIDGDAINTVVTDGKVYNMAGQYVGNSLEGLSKGMYIVNGKKYIVR